MTLIFSWMRNKLLIVLFSCKSQRKYDLKVNLQFHATQQLRVTVAIAWNHNIFYQNVHQVSNMNVFKQGLEVISLGHVANCYDAIVHVKEVCRYEIVILVSNCGRKHLVDSLQGIVFCFIQNIIHIRIVAYWNYNMLRLLFNWENPTQKLILSLHKDCIISEVLKSSSLSFDTRCNQLIKKFSKFFLYLKVGLKLLEIFSLFSVLIWPHFY